jgi:hypothetical protein
MGERALDGSESKSVTPPAARGGAGRDARRGETPAASPGAKTPSATAARGGAGRDARRGETPAASPGAKTPSAPTPRPWSSDPSPSAPPLLRSRRPSEPESPQPAHGSAPRVAASGCLSRELRRSPEPLTGERAPDNKRIALNGLRWPSRAIPWRPVAPGSAPRGHMWHSHHSARAPLQARPYSD